MIQSKGKFVWILLMILIVSACGQAGETRMEEDQNDRLVIYTSIYPLYDFAQKIAGDRAVVKNITPPGVEAHDFEPKVKDMVELNDADLLIYNGAGFERWIDKVDAALNSDKLTLVDASQGIELLSAEQEGEHAHGDDDHHHGEWDPHIWLDPNRAKQQAETITRALIEIDPSNEAKYERNFALLSEQFDELDGLFRKLSEHANHNEILVSHASFGYMTETYGFKQIAVTGLSPSHEPTQRELREIIEQAQASEVNYILFETLVSGKIAEVVQRETGAEALTLNPLENVTERELEQGKDYFAIMEANIEVLKKALDASW